MTSDGCLLAMSYIPMWMFPKKISVTLVTLYSESDQDHYPVLLLYADVNIKIRDLQSWDFYRRGSQALILRFINVVVLIYLSYAEHQSSPRLYHFVDITQSVLS